MERISGRLHDETRGETLAQIAVRMRADVAELKRKGTLPEGVEVSVRTRSGNSVDLIVTGLLDAKTWREEDGSRRELTPYGRRISDALENVHGAYNEKRDHGGGQDYADQRYFGGVELLTEERQAWEREWRGDRQAKTARARQARATAEAAPLRATVKDGRPVALVVAQRDGGAVVDTVVLETWRRAGELTGSEVDYRLGEAGWKILDYVRRSKSNPVPYWTVEPTTAATKAAAGNAPATPAAPAPEPEQPPAMAEVDTSPAPTTAPDPEPQQPPAEVVEPAVAEAPAAATEEAAASAPRDKLAVTVATFDTERIVQLLGAISRRRSMPTGHEATVGRALIGELRTRLPAAFDAVAEVDPGSKGYLRALVKAASSAPPPPRGTPAKDDRELCEADPRARPIELDGTGLSGTHCPTPVNRRRALIPTRPELGSTTGAEKCMELATWSLPGDFATPPSGLAEGFCIKHAAEKLRDRPLPEVEEPAAEPDAASTQPEQPAEQPAEDGDDAWNWDGLTLHHSTPEGTILFGTSHGDGAYEALQAAGQHWKRGRKGVVEGELFVPRSRGHAPQLAFLAKAEEVLVAAGFKVRGEIDEAPRVAEARADESERAGERVERLDRGAKRASAGAEAAGRRADEIGERFTGAQPIVGSPAVRRGALRDQARMHAADDRRWELDRKAKYLADRAAAAAKAAARKDKPLQIARRIARAETELRKVEQKRKGLAPGPVLDQLDIDAAHAAERITLDRDALAVHVEEGRWRIVPIKEIKPGDAVLSDGWGRVESVGRTRVKIDAGPGMEIYWGIHEIGDHRTAAQLAEARERRAQQKAAAAASDSAPE